MKAKIGALPVFLLVLFPAFGCQAQNAVVLPDPGNMMANAEEKAKTEEKQNVWDFGKIKKGQTEERTFDFKNETGRLLTITGINTSCGCTGSTIKDKVLPDGKSTQVAVKFKSEGYHSGPVQQYVFINTDDPNNSVIRYTVKIEVTE